MLKTTQLKLTKIYFGLAETFFKARFGNHNKDFNHEQYKKSTEFSKYLWLLKGDQKMSIISCCKSIW